MLLRLLSLRLFVNWFMEVNQERKVKYHVEVVIALSVPLSSQAKYISTCIDEIKQELKQDNIAVKANAVCKLTYVRPQTSTPH